MRNLSERKSTKTRRYNSCPSAWEEFKWFLTIQVLLEATDTNKAFLELTRSAGSSWTSCRRGRTCRSASTACIQESSGQGSRGRSPESSSGTRTRTLAPACHELDPERSCYRDWISKWLKIYFGATIGSTCPETHFEIPNSIEQAAS